MAAAVMVSTPPREAIFWSQKEMKEASSSSSSSSSSSTTRGTRVKVDHLSPSDARGSGDASGVDVVDFLPAEVECPASKNSEKKKVLENAVGIAFVYGTLKKGFGNYWLMQELVEGGHAQLIGSARTKQRYPLVCGPFAVPFLLDIPSDGWCVKGEVYKVDAKAQEVLDEKEGTTVGHYMRKPLLLTDLTIYQEFVPSSTDQWYHKGEEELLAEAYFAHDNIALGLAKASSSQYIEAFTEAQARHYIVRKDRPKNRTFLEHVRLWIHERTTREKRQP